MPEKKSKVKRKTKLCEMWPNFVAVISLLCLALFAWAQAGPVPIVNEVSTHRSVGSKWYGEYEYVWSRKCKKFTSSANLFGTMTFYMNSGTDSYSFSLFLLQQSALTVNKKITF